MPDAHRELIRRRRKAILAAVVEAEREFAMGLCRPMTPEEIIQGIFPAKGAAEKQSEIPRSPKKRRKHE